MVLAYEGEEGDDLDLTRTGTLGADLTEPKKQELYQPPVECIYFDEAVEVASAAPRKLSFLVYATAQTDPGMRRKNNEDSLLVLESEGLFAVADGMGGYSGGEIASELVTKTLETAALTKQYDGIAHAKMPLEASELARSIQMANAEIQRLAARTPKLKGMGTTVCVARFVPEKERVYIGHVGDSRCYRLRDGTFRAMTADHTMADHGVTGPESSHLSRAVGIWPTIPIDIIIGTPKIGDMYLICSDGLTKMLDDDIIGNVLRSEADPKAAVERLVFFANSRGGKDNITTVLVRVVAATSSTRPHAHLRGTLVGL